LRSIRQQSDENSSADPSMRSDISILRIEVLLAD